MPATTEWPWPEKGGSYIRDKTTGKLTRRAPGLVVSSSDSETGRAGLVIFSSDSKTGGPSGRESARHSRSTLRQCRTSRCELRGDRAVEPAVSSSDELSPTL